MVMVEICQNIENQSKAINIITIQTESERQMNIFTSVFGLTNWSWVSLNVHGRKIKKNREKSNKNNYLKNMYCHAYFFILIRANYLDDMREKTAKEKF